MNHSILHITDLHLDNFTGTDEHLRKGYYKEYIDDLVVKIKKSGTGIDTIIVTGDLVNKGKVENFEQVGIIIEYLANKIDVKKENICFCIGNHDYKYKEELPDGSNSGIVREPYFDFVQSFNQNVIYKNQRIVLIEITTNVFYLSIDATLGSHDSKLQGKPGIITQTEIDEILSEVIHEKIPVDSLLLIGCHYPIINFPSGLPGHGEDTWEENHLWKSANALRTRINNIKSITKIWFMGDCHIPDHIEFEDAYFIMTGRFGGTTNISDPAYISQIPRQCKIISFRNESEPVLVHTFSFEPTTHKDNPNYGNWAFKIGEIRAIKAKDFTSEKLIETKKIHYLIHENTQEMILSRILEKNLYSFGRFVTSTNNTSLGWVNINQLLNSTELLSNIVNKSLKYITEQLKLDFSSSLIVGLDFWGTIIGSQLSIRTGMKNYAVATRGNGQYHSVFELSNTYLEHELINCKEVLFFIDVISCGETLNRVIENCIKINDKLEFHAISVISNADTIKKENFSKIKSSGTFCEKLKIPVIKNEELPSDEYLPPSVDLSFKK
ncbi:MAG: metallophosphoesterase [Bacteroidetes bacterium]|nr:metallophosphoesterase [Bacteroidota bacterium]